MQQAEAIKPNEIDIGYEEEDQSFLGNQTRFEELQKNRVNEHDVLLKLIEKFGGDEIEWKASVTSETNFGRIDENDEIWFMDLRDKTEIKMSDAYTDKAKYLQIVSELSTEGISFDQHINLQEKKIQVIATVKEGSVIKTYTFSREFKFEFNSLEEVIKAKFDNGDDWTNVKTFENSHKLAKDNSKETIANKSEVWLLLKSQGWAEIWKEDQETGKVIQEIYFADAAGNVSYLTREAVKLEERNKEEHFDLDTFGDLDGTYLNKKTSVIVNLDTVLKPVVEAPEKTNTWQDFWDKLLKPKAELEKQIDTTKTNLLDVFTPAKVSKVAGEHKETNSDSVLNAWLSNIDTKLAVESADTGIRIEANRKTQPGKIKEREYQGASSTIDTESMSIRKEGTDATPQYTDNLSPTSVKTTETNEAEQTPFEQAAGQSFETIPSLILQASEPKETTTEAIVLKSLLDIPINRPAKIIGKLDGETTSLKEIIEEPENTQSTGETNQAEVVVELSKDMEDKASQNLNLNVEYAPIVLQNEVDQSLNQKTSTKEAPEERNLEIPSDAKQTDTRQSEAIQASIKQEPNQQIKLEKPKVENEDKEETTEGAKDDQTPNEPTQEVLQQVKVDEETVPVGLETNTIEEIISEPIQKKPVVNLKEEPQAVKRVIDKPRYKKADAPKPAKVNQAPTIIKKDSPKALRMEKVKIQEEATPIPAIMETPQNLELPKEVRAPQTIRIEVGAEASKTFKLLDEQPRKHVLVKASTVPTKTLVRLKKLQTAEIITLFNNKSSDAGAKQSQYIDELLENQQQAIKLAA